MFEMKFDLGKITMEQVENLTNIMTELEVPYDFHFTAEDKAVLTIGEQQ